MIEKAMHSPSCMQITGVSDALNPYSQRLKLLNLLWDFFVFFTERTQRSVGIFLTVRFA